MKRIGVTVATVLSSVSRRGVRINGRLETAALRYLASLRAARELGAQRTFETNSSTEGSVENLGGWLAAVPNRP